MLSYAILADVFRQISNPQVTCLSNHFAPNSSFGTGCCGIVWRHCTTTHNLQETHGFFLYKFPRNSANIFSQDIFAPAHLCEREILFDNNEMQQFFSLKKQTKKEKLCFTFFSKKITTTTTTIRINKKSQLSPPG